jgi:DNA transformation protein
MKGDKGLFEYVKNEILSEIPDITSKSMFGGYGFYKNGIIFGMIAAGKFYLKTGNGNLDEFKKQGSQPFTYTGKNGKPYVMSYWELPEGILENKTELVKWINRSVIESLNSKKKK